MGKRIVIISGNFFGQVSGGAEYQQFLLASHLKRAGHRIYYIFVDNKDPIRVVNEFDLIRIRKRALLRKLFGRPFFLDFFKLSRKLNKIAPDVIIVRGGFAYVGIAARYRSYHNCKMIWQIASRSDVEPFRKKLNRSFLFDCIDKKFLEYGIKKADFILGQADYQSDLMDKHYNRRCDLIIANFHPEPVEKIEKKEPIKIVWVSNFKALKRPELFIELASRFNGRDDLKFIMIGRSSHVGPLKKIGRMIQQVENVDYKGELSLEEVNKTLSGSHILVNTSSLEGFPNIFIQSWMRRVPVVSLDIDPDDIIKKRRIGFHSGSFSRMVEDISTLICDSKLREEMGERAQQFALRNFSMANIDKIVRLIEA